MDFDLGWILLGLPLAFVLGWLSSRFDIRQLRLENRQNPKAYFKGLNHLLNEQQDQAIDAFIQAVQQDPDTSELHFALGSLFRRRGEFDCAVRVHQHLLARSDLGREEHERAQSALAYDFLKAGLLDRAEEGFAKLMHTPHEQQAQLALLSIFEKTRDWQKPLTSPRPSNPKAWGISKLAKRTTCANWPFRPWAHHHLKLTWPKSVSSKPRNWPLCTPERFWPVPIWPTRRDKQGRLTKP